MISMRCAIWLPFIYLLMLPILSGAQVRQYERISVGSNGEQANAGSESPVLSHDGRFVAFTARASNLVPGDTNGRTDIFVRDRENGTTERISISSTGEQANEDCSAPSMSEDGRYIAFASRAGNLVPGDTNDTTDVFLHDRQTKTTECISLKANNETGSVTSNSPSLSGDGRLLAYSLSVYEPDPFGGFEYTFVDKVVVYDRDTGQLREIARLKGDTYTTETIGGPVMARNGRYVAYEYSNWGWEEIRGYIVVKSVEGNDRRAFLSDLRTTLDTYPYTPWEENYAPALSADGLTVAYQAHAGRISSGGPIQWTGNVLCSNDGPIPSISSTFEDVAISPEGRFIYFASGMETLVPSDTNDQLDIFVYDTETARTKVIAAGNGHSWHPITSGDGELIAFVSEASNLTGGDTNGEPDIYIVNKPVQKPAYILWQSARSGDVTYWDMDGLQRNHSDYLLRGLSRDWKLVASADLDHDAKPDVVWHNAVSGDVTCWLMDGIQIRAYRTLARAIPREWKPEGVTDITRDGRPDILWRNTRTGDITCWQMNGIKIERYHTLYRNLPRQWILAGATDMNGDGHADLLWRNTQNGDLTYWRMNGLSIAQFGLLRNRVPTEWRMVGVLDLTYDGRPDLIWHNTQTGDLALWQMNGLAIESMAQIQHAVPLEWLSIGTL